MSLTINARALLSKFNDKHSKLESKFHAVVDTLTGLANTGYMEASFITIEDHSFSSISFKYLGERFEFSYRPVIENNAIIGSINFYSIGLKQEKELLKSMTFDIYGVVDYLDSDEDSVRLVDNDSGLENMLMEVLLEGVRKKFAKT